MDGTFAARVVGPNLTLRLITPDDTSYVQSLRTDPTYNRHLSAVLGTLEDQRRWIAGYKARESEGREFYYVIERRDGMRCGLVRLYDIGDDSFTWGSWILDANKPRKAALESAFLIYRIAFEQLKLQRAEFDVRRDNEKTLQFHRRFGAKQTHESEQDIYFVYERTTFEADRTSFARIIEEENLK